MESKLRRTSQSTHILATKMSSDMRHNEIEAARNLYSAFLERALGVCAPDPKGLNLGVMIVALASLLANCLDEYCNIAEPRRPWGDQHEVKKEYVM